MKKLLLVIATTAMIAIPGISSAEVTRPTAIPQHVDTACQWIDGYYRQDGTYVQGHWRGC